MHTHKKKTYLAKSDQEPAVSDSYKEGKPKIRVTDRDGKTKGNNNAENLEKKGWKNKEHSSGMVDTTFVDICINTKHIPICQYNIQCINRTGAAGGPIVLSTA